MTELPDLSCLSHDEKDALIRALGAQVQMLTAQVQTLAARVAELEAKLGQPPKTPDNSSMPPLQGKKPNRADYPTLKARSRAAWNLTLLAFARARCANAAGRAGVDAHDMARLVARVGA